MSKTLIRAVAALAHKDQNIERLWRLWTADCAAHVLHLYEVTGISDAPRNAIAGTRQFARGTIDANELDDLARDAWMAALPFTAGAAGYASRAAARVPSLATLTCAASWDTRWLASIAGGEAEKDWQIERFFLWVSDKEPADWPLRKNK